MTATIDNLPPEILSKIILELPITFILRCKLISKKFFSLIQALKIKNLVLTDNCYGMNTFISKKYVGFDCNDKIGIQKPGSIEPMIRQNQFTNLKHLLIYCRHFEVLIENSKSINDLSHLEHLEMIGLDLQYSREPTFYLNLDYLKTLNIEKTDYKRMEIRAPNLKNLKIESNKLRISTTIFLHNESLNFVELSVYEQFVSEFINLEHFYCKNMIELNDSNFLSKLPKLKLIHMNLEEQIFNSLLEQKRTLDRKDLKIYLFGVQLKTFSRMDESGFDIDSSTKDFFTKNLDRMDSHLPFCGYLDYSSLESSLNNLTSDFCQKFSNLRTLQVSDRVVNLGHLEMFLTHCRSITELDLVSTLLDQKFFEHSLPFYLPRLECIYINQEHQIESFWFLLKFQSLELISVGHELPFDLVKEAFKKFKKLGCFKFYHSGDLIQVCSTLNKKTVLVGISGKRIDFNNFETLFCFLRNLSKS